MAMQVNEFDEYKVSLKGSAMVTFPASVACYKNGGHVGTRRVK